MEVETSTLNMALAAVIAMQAWLVRQVYTLKSRLDVIASHCRACRNGERES